MQALGLPLGFRNLPPVDAEESTNGTVRALFNTNPKKKRRPKRKKKIIAQDLVQVDLKANMISHIT